MLKFRELARDYGIPLADSGHRHCSKGWVQTNCPFCDNGGDGYHLGFNLSKGNFACWRCGGKMGYNKVLRALLPNVPLYELYAKYLDGIRDAPTRVTRRPGQAAKVKFPEDCHAGLSRAHRDYLLGREFNPAKMIENWDLRCTTGLAGHDWNWRIIIPIYNAEGRLVSYTGRAIGEDVELRYKTLEPENSVENPKSVLYGEHLCTLSEAVVVVEGPLDVWRIGPGAVGLLGAAWSVEQAVRLRKYKKVLILPDNDAAGIASAYRLANWLASSDAEVEVLEGLEGDPGEMTEAEAREFRDEYLS